MKKTLLSLVALVAAISVNAQVGVLTKAPRQSFTPKKMLNAPAKIEAGENQAWWGYVGTDEEYYGLGVQNAETYDCAIYIPGNHAVAGGKTINAIRFAMESKKVSNVKVWLANSLPSSINANNTLALVNVTSLQQGINDVQLPTPVTIGNNGIYVGYTFTITQVSTSADAYPICFVDQLIPNAMFLRTSQSVTSWMDGSADYGSIVMQVLLEGEFPQNAAGISNLGECVAALGSEGLVKMPLTNGGMQPITSIDYTITDVESATEGELQHVELDAPVTKFSTKTISINVAADATSGIREKSVAIKKVNNVDNEATTGTQGSLTLVTVSKTVDRGIAVEEFTGTGCGWCPRGLVGMEKLRETFGDKFVGIGVHGYNSGDPMYFNWQQQYHSGIFDGSAPSCQMNRYYGEIDPYYGSGYDIIDNFNEQLSIPAKVGLSVVGEWNEDSTQVLATATIEGIVDGGNFSIEYMLIADGLTGTANSWKQTNYYSSAYASSTGLTLNGLEDDLKFLWTAGASYFTTFNDVCVATSFASRQNKADAVGEVNDGDIVTNEYTLAMPTKTTVKNAIKSKDQVAVVALLVNSDGTIANAAKFYMPVYSPTTAISTLGAESNAEEVARYAADGRRLLAPQKGLNIVKKADGSIVKVFVR